MKANELKYTNLMVGDIVQNKERGIFSLTTEDMIDILLGKLKVYDVEPSMDFVEDNGFVCLKDVDDQEWDIVEFSMVYNKYKCIVKYSYGNYSLKVYFDNVVILNLPIPCLREFRHELKICGLNELADNLKV